MKASEYTSTQTDYVNEGVQRAQELGNRGPVRFDAAGNLHPDILEAYWRTGFYVFENLVDQAEIQLLRNEIDDLL
ncbi:MAG: hypothetical protein ACPGXJ_02755, partial [Pseudomonadales bacterium]